MPYDMVKAEQSYMSNLQSKDLTRSQTFDLQTKAKKKIKQFEHLQSQNRDEQQRSSCNSLSQ